MGVKKKKKKTRCPFVPSPMAFWVKMGVVGEQRVVLCVGQVRAIGNLRGDAGTPAHPLLTAAP